MEYLNVYSPYGEKTGEVAERSEVHRKGIYHRVFHLWIINENNQVLIQQRSADKDTGANLWYVSVGGHIESHETMEQAIVRETAEELGLDIAPHLGDIHYLFTFQETNSENNKDVIDCEFYDVFVLRYDAPIDQIVMQESEVQAVKYVDYSDLINSIVFDRSFVAHDTAYKMLQIALGDYLRQWETQ